MQAAFPLAYAVMYPASDKLTESVGTRKGFRLIMIW